MWRTAGSGSSLPLSYQRPLTQPAGWLSTGWPVPVRSWQVHRVEEETGRRGLALGHAWLPWGQRGSEAGGLLFDAGRP